MRLLEFNVGDRVKGSYNDRDSTYTGTIICIHDVVGRACVERDDRQTGGGCGGTWNVMEKNGHVMSDGRDGNKLEFYRVLPEEGDILVEKIIKKYKRE